MLEMRHWIKSFILFVLVTSCSQPDYSKEIIGKWECVKMEIEFEGTPDDDLDMYSFFKSGIEFKPDLTCTGYISTASLENQKKDKPFYLGEIWSGSHNYTISGSQLLIDGKHQFTIIKIEKDILEMDWHLTLTETQYNLGRLNKLRRQGTGENVIIHYTF